MHYPESFQVTASSGCEIEVTRNFHAPRQLVFDAFTKPELVRRWLLGPGGWTMPVCEIDLRVGGAYRYVWSKESSKGTTVMGMGGFFREIESPARLVATEKFDEAWYPGEAITITEFADAAPVTRTKITVRYQSREARDAALSTGMESGMKAGYDRLETLLEELLK
jgi:uncharacterized protein YndB with AHSA1/START domain